MDKYFKDVNDWFREEASEYVRDCLVCGKNGYIGLDSSLATCSNCGFVWSYSQPTQGVLDKFYNDSRPIKAWAEIKKTPQEKVRQHEKYELMWDYASRVNSILDVGCGNGFFLNEIGHEVGTVVGIEPSEHAAKECSFNVFNSYEKMIENEWLKSHKFDFITMFGVLEHLKDPHAEIEKYAKHLGEDGAFGIIVPNVDSLAVKVLGKECSTFCPQHLSYFNLTTLSKFFYSHGFVLCRHITAEDEIQPVLRKLRGLKPYLKLGIDLTDKDITHDKVIDNDLGYKICAIFKRGR